MTRERRRVKRSVNVGDAIGKARKSDAPAHEDIRTPEYEITPVSEYYQQHARMLRRNLTIECLSDETKARVEKKAGKPVDELEVEELLRRVDVVEGELQAEAEKKELEMRRASMSDEMKKYLEERAGKNIEDISLEELKSLFMKLVTGDPSVN